MFLFWLYSWTEKLVPVRRDRRSERLLQRFIFFSFARFFHRAFLFVSSSRNPCLEETFWTKLNRRSIFNKSRPLRISGLVSPFPTTRSRRCSGEACHWWEGCRWVKDVFIYQILVLRNGKTFQNITLSFSGCWTWTLSKSAIACL